VHVLFITEKYHSGPAYGLTNNIHNLIGSYECSGYGTYKHCFIDPEDIWSSQGVDEALLSNEYDAAVISVYHHLPSPGVAGQVKARIKHGLPFIFMTGGNKIDDSSAKNLKALGVIPKPFRLTDLYEFVNKAISAKTSA
jgi:hypothetical protein